MAQIDATEITTQRETPKIIGFRPADFILSNESPAPIRNSVNTNKDFEMSVIPSVIISEMGR